jgi:hypothetical protein
LVDQDCGWKLKSQNLKVKNFCQTRGAAQSQYKEKQRAAQGAMTKDLLFSPQCR